MIHIVNKAQCCGCQACANICPKTCISMRADAEGFLYPQVDTKNCVNCGLCEKVCPILHKPQTFPVLATYAAKHINNDIKLKSSSGGIFTALAEVILKQDGVVFGAAFDKDWNVVHSYVEKLEDLDKLRRSKYVQSNIGKTYQQAEQFLEQGRMVLFTGTPCQMAGLRNYLGKEYENLLTADLFCHGTPSPGVWQKFLRENFNIAQIQAIDFREKRIAWNKFYLSFQLADGLHVHGNKKTILEKIWDFFCIQRGISLVYYNSFFNGFLSELINRPSCHTCAFRTNRCADISLGDLWGAWPQVIKQQDKRLGISAITINTDKAKKLLSQLSITTQLIDFNQLAKINFPLISSPIPHPKRTEFFARYQMENVSKLVRELLDIKSVYIVLPWKLTKKVVRKLRNWLK